MAQAPDPQSHGVDQMLCLALHAASRAMTSRYRTLLEPFGLTYPQYLVVTVLELEGCSSMVDIGSALRLESSTLSPLVRRLETLGLVSRTRSTVDERIVEIDLTDAGRALGARMAAVPQQIADATGLSPAEQNDLTERLHRLEANLRR